MPTAVEKQKNIEEAITLPQVTLPKEDFEDRPSPEVLYETDPKKVSHDIIVNTGEKPYILLKKGTHSTMRLAQGDRMKSPYYTKVIEEEARPFSGLQMCFKLTEEHLKRLENIRRKKTSMEPSNIVKEMWEHKDKNADDNYKRPIKRGRS